MEINNNKCTKCNLCTDICMLRCIDLEKSLFNEEKCIKCFQCMAICPVGAITHEGKIGEKITPHKISSENYENLIKNRRTHRIFLDKPVPENLIKKMIDLIKYSPTGTNSQKVNVTVINDKEKIQIFSKKVMRFFTNMANIFINYITFPLLFIILGPKRTSGYFGMKKELKRYWAGEDILTYNAPSLFIFHSPRSASTPEQDCITASTIAVLYAETLGLSTCFNGFIVYALKFNKGLKKYLKIPKNHNVYSAFLLGYPKNTFKRGVFREDIRSRYNLL